MSEFAEILNRCLIISLGCFYLCFEAAKMNFLIINAYTSTPMLIFPVIMYAFVLRTSILQNFLTIHAILASGTNPKIISLIIQAISIDMVNPLVRKIQQFSVHIHSFIIIPTSSILIATGEIPFILIDKFKIFIINLCESTLCKLDQLHNLEIRGAS